MFFNSAKDARLYAKLEIIRTGRQHVVKPCRKYLCPPREYFGQESIPGFTVILTRGRIRK